MNVRRSRIIENKFDLAVIIAQDPVVDPIRHFEGEVVQVRRRLMFWELYGSAVGWTSEKEVSKDQGADRLPGIRAIKIHFDDLVGSTVVEEVAQYQFCSMFV